MHTQHNAQTIIIIIYNIGLLINPTVIVPPRDSVRRHLIRNLILFYILFIHSARWHDGRLILLSLLVLCDGFDNRIIILLVITNTYYMCIHVLLYDHFHILHIRQLHCNLNKIFVWNYRTKFDLLITLLISVMCL